jgi:hypothetical protein
MNYQFILNIILFRLQLKAFVRTCGRVSTPAEKVDIVKRRDRLQGRVMAWNGRALTYLEVDDDDQTLFDLCRQDAANNDADDEFWDTESEDGSVNPFEVIAETDGTAELATLYFPSSFAPTRYPGQSVKEMTLRTGQANDALHNLRIQLGKKSFLYRGHVRPARSQQTKTRAWSEIKGVEGSVRQYARYYASARRAMIRLNADEECLDRYQLLTRADLKVTTAISDPNARGQRHVHLSWFWTMDVQRDSQAEDWMEECE